MKAPGTFTVSGPGIDRRVPSSGVGLSLATTRASREQAAATFVVRDADGNAVGRAERDEFGVVRTWRLA